MQQALGRHGLRARRDAAEARQHHAGAGAPAHVEAELLQARVRQRRSSPRQHARAARVADRGRRLGRQRVEAHRHLDDRAERPVGAGEQLGQVVAGDVLDHLAAALGDGAVGERHAHADHEVARAAEARAQRPGVVGRDDAADRGAAAVRRVEREHLAGLAEGLLRAGQRHARLQHRGQVAGVVLHDPVEARGGDLDVGPGIRRPAQLRAGAAQPHPAARLGGGRQLAGQLGRRPRRAAADLGRRHQKRSATPACSSGCWR